MKKEALTAFNGFKLMGEAIPRLKKSHPELFKKTDINRLPEAVFENIKKNHPKLDDDTRAFLLYFNGNLVEFLSGDYAGPDADRKKAADAAFEGMLAVETAVNYLLENKPEIFSPEQAVTIPANITGFITEMKHKISVPGRDFMEQFLGFVSFNLEKGFIQYDPTKKYAPRQMDLF
jgi:hypothetical protein